MPWCDTCDRFYNPNTLAVDGSCPTCRRVIAEPPAAEAGSRAPWHFKVLIAITVVYLGYRLLQGILWVAHQL